MPQVASLPKQARFLIGPPAGPADMKALYVQAEQRLAGGDDGMVKKLFELRKSAVAYFATAKDAGKPMLQRLLEEKLGRALGSVVASVEGTYSAGVLVPHLVIDLAKTTYPDGSPVTGDFSKDLMLALKNALGFVFGAEWVQERLV